MALCVGIQAATVRLRQRYTFCNGYGQKALPFNTQPTINNKLAACEKFWGPLKYVFPDL